jgi:glycine hydroxymethyltransferase
MHIVAAKAVAFKEALQPEFRVRAADRRECEGAGAALQEGGFRIISGGTDNHVMLVDVFSKGILGSEAELALGKAGITVNKNAIPYDTNPPLKPSGIRIGTPALTTRGMKEPEMRQIALWIGKALESRGDDAVLTPDSRRSGGAGQSLPSLCLAA